MGMGGPQPGVTVHAHKEEGGIIAEKITAKDGEALLSYLQSKGIGIKRGALPVLDNYIGKDYTFIVAWLKKSITTAEDIPRGLYLKFPAREIYYPLYPTSIYGDKYIPITLYIAGFCSPKFYEKIADWSQTNYWIGFLEAPSPGPGIPPSGAVEELLRTLPVKDRFTIVNINAPAKFFTSDLWISPRTPARIFYAFQINRYCYQLGLIIFLISSLLSGYIIGRIVFAQLRKEPLILLAIGFLNLFSLFGIIFSLFFLKLKPADTSIKETLEELRKKGYQKRRFYSFALYWLSLFLFILTFFYPKSPLHFPFLFLALICLLLAFLLQRVKKEDEPLFSQLIEAGYSPYFFFPAERSKLAFLPLFSITFLLFLYLLFAILKLPMMI